MHPDFLNLFHLSKAEEFFHYCLKKFERERVGVAIVVDDSEVTDAFEGDEEEGGEKLDVKKKLPKEKYHDDDDDDDDDNDVDIPMAKLTVKEK